MQVFLYEYVTGGGLLHNSASEPPSGSLLREGTAMIRALAADFARMDRCEVQLMLDGRLDPEIPFDARIFRIADAGQEQECFRQLATSADCVIVIAPEFDGILLDRVRCAQQCGAVLISPSLDFIVIAADKHLTARALAAAGLRVPVGMEIEAGAALPVRFSYPAVIKPRDGAGSLGTRLLRNRDEAFEFGTVRQDMRLELLCHGQPASVAVLCGSESLVVLPACSQKVSSCGDFEYQGGTTPLCPRMCVRAQQLAAQAVQALPATRGYVGVDLILGCEEDGTADVVLEINPRLTTSYVGLRQLCVENLAEAMLTAARGESVTISQRGVRVEFDADGTVRVEDREELETPS